MLVYNGNISTEEEVEVIEDLIGGYALIIFNDDVNTFDHVIETLVVTCNHSYVQAEQCSILVHYKGKCTVKTGPYSDLEPRCSKLLQAGLIAEII